jgi:hypothetical protein
MTTYKIAPISKLPSATMQIIAHAGIGGGPKNEQEDNH